jgi:hypothetical protein
MRKRRFLFTYLGNHVDTFPIWVSTCFCYIDPQRICLFFGPCFFWVSIPIHLFREFFLGKIKNRQAKIDKNDQFFPRGLPPYFWTPNSLSPLLAKLVKKQWISSLGSVSFTFLSKKRGVTHFFDQNVNETEPKSIFVVFWPILLAMGSVNLRKKKFAEPITRKKTILPPKNL